MAGESPGPRWQRFVFCPTDPTPYVAARPKKHIWALIVQKHFCGISKYQISRCASLVFEWLQFPPCAAVAQPTLARAQAQRGAGSRCANSAGKKNIGVRSLDHARSKKINKKQRARERRTLYLTPLGFATFAAGRKQRSATHATT